METAENGRSKITRGGRRFRTQDGIDVPGAYTVTRGRNVETIRLEEVCSGHAGVGVEHREQVFEHRFLAQYHLAASCSILKHTCLLHSSVVRQKIV